MMSLRNLSLNLIHRRLFLLKSIALVFLFLLAGLQPGFAQAVNQSHSSGVHHPKWAKNANIYEVNIRQYTKQGTISAFKKHLPRLQNMGVKILWLMPVYPIGKKNRKGPLGSYYSVRNYKKINPHFGTRKDLRQLVAAAHKRGMKVILDWVANHTAWDNVWTKSHSDWYTKNKKGHFKPPVKGWTDVIDLNYSSQAMRDSMIAAMKFWVNKTNIDGFRCDYAKGVPNDFWIRAQRELDAIKPVFMLAEGNKPSLHKAFDMTYAWDYYGLFNKIAAGDTSLTDLNGQLQKERKKYAPDDYRMLFTSNHDENSWHGSAPERLGKNTKVFAVLAATLDGMPLTYGGQEAGLSKRLAFFKKDEIHWNRLPLQHFYHTLLHLKSNNHALWNGDEGGFYMVIKTKYPRTIFAFRRSKSGDRVIVAVNISDQSRQIHLPRDLYKSSFRNVFSGKEMKLQAKPISIPAHGYLVLEQD